MEVSDATDMLQIVVADDPAVSTSHFLLCGL